MTPSNPADSRPMSVGVTVVAWAVFLPALYAVSLVSYLLFHSLAEIFTIVIEFAIFITAWNGRRFLSSHYLLFLGCAYAAVAFMDMLHVLAYRGMGVFPRAETDLATQLWIAARYVSSASVAVAPWFIRRRGSPHLFLALFFTVAAALVFSVFAHIFPACFVEGVGLTRFKIVSEYVIALLFATGAVLLIIQRDAFDTPVLRLLVASLALRVAAEMAFTTYANAYAAANMIGHLLRILAAYLLYKAIIETVFLRPYALLFRDLKRREDELEASLTELESFSHSVSHDLRAPLSAMSGFSELLEREYGEQLPEDGRHYVKRIRAAAKRMNELIDDLLRLSRISRQPMSVGVVDVSALAAGIVAELREREPQRQVDVVIEPAIICRGDEPLMKIALENLLGNAWKFTSKREGARIVVAPHPEAGFVVRDNGAGFDPQHADKLFAPFQRLHRASEFPGTGIGLATVKRIVSRHGGRVSATAAIGEGAVFSVQLPTGTA